MLTEPDAVRVLCFGDSNTHGAPGDDPEYVRLGPDVRWTGRLQRLLGDGYDVVEEGLNGRTTDVDCVDRPHCNGRTAFPAALMSHDLDSHESLARLVADVVQGTRTPPIA